MKQYNKYTVIYPYGELEFSKYTLPYLYDYRIESINELLLPILDNNELKLNKNN